MSKGGTGDNDDDDDDDNDDNDTMGSPPAYGGRIGFLAPACDSCNLCIRFMGSVTRLGHVSVARSNEVDAGVDKEEEDEKEEGVRASNASSIIRS